MASSPNDQQKTKYGDYEIVKPIGKGKFAVVYRAKRISNEEVVALKRINVDSIDDKARDKTLKEVGFLQSLDHPNIIKYLDSFINDNDLVIVFEWAAAGDLKRQVRKAQERGVGFEERVIWKYFSQICNAIQHMHERRIMHRDLKPANIFLTLDGTVKVGDLGLSRELSENTIQAHSKVGTPLYMSPEVLKGDGYDFKSDIWSLGCILYELAMLKSPFKAEGLNLYSLFQKISKGDYLPLPEQYSDELKSLAYEMISTSPNDRPEIGPSCDMAQEMRAVYSDKQKAAKRQAEAQARVEERKRRDEQEQAEAERQEKGRDEADAKESDRGTFDQTKGLPAPEGQEEREQIPAERGQEGNDRQQRQGAGTAERKDDNDHDGGYIPSQPRAPPARPSSGDGAGDDKGWAREQHRNNGASGGGGGDGWARGEAGSRQKEIDSGWALQDQGPMGGQDRRGGASWGDAERTQQQRPDPGYESPVDFQRDEPAKTKAAAPRVTRRAKQSPSPSKGPGARAGAGAELWPDSPESPLDNKQGRRDGSGPGPGPSSRGADHGRQGDGASRQIDFEAFGRGGQTSNNLASRAGSAASRGSDALNAIKNGFVAFALSDAIYNKLVVLGCPLDDNLSGIPGKHRKPNGHGRLLPVHFAIDLSTLGGVAGYKDGAQGGQEQFFQFRRFTEICVWLLLKIGGRGAQLASALDMDANSPTMIAKQLLMMGGEVGLSDEALAQCTPTGLTAGYGEQVCYFLDALVDKCSAAMALGVRRLQYPAADADSDAGNDDDVLADEADEEEAEDQVEEDIIGFMGSGDGESPAKSGMIDLYADVDAMEPTGAHQDSRHGTNNNTLLGSPGRHGTEYITSDVDPKEWAQETERVAPALARAKLRAAGAGAGNWAVHLDKLRGYDSKFGSGTDAAAAAGERPASIPEILRDINLLQRGVGEARDRMAKAEGMINVKSTISRLGGEYGSHKSELVRLEGIVTDKTAQISALGDSLASVSERLSEVKEEMEDRHGHVSGAGGDGGGDSGGGTHQVIRYRTALQRMKEDVNAISLSVGMTEALLSAKRQLHSKERRSEHSKKAASRRGRGKRGGGEEKSALD